MDFQAVSVGTETMQNAHLSFGMQETRQDFEVMAAKKLQARLER